MPTQYIVFILDSQRYALDLPAVERVERMVHITPLAGAPAIVLGIVNMHGRIIPVIDVRQRFNLPRREVSLATGLFLHIWSSVR